MYKVLIADDEKKVCQLIKMLVEWEKLSMEVIGVANNGCEALEIIKEKNPDIVITDIRMPGLNGLEMIEEVREHRMKTKFVIISGYREFKYAQAAVRYGVNEYLLKPIRQEELLQTLENLKEKFELQNEKANTEEQMRKQLEFNRIKLRRGLFFDILFQGGAKKEKLTISNINEDYGYDFKEGFFQAVCIRLDHAERIYHSSSEILEEKSIHLVKQELFDYCYEIGAVYENGVLYTVLNYAKESVLLVKKGIKNLLSESLMQDAIYQQLDVTVGAGNVTEDISGLMDSFRHAEYAYQQRILNGVGKVYECTQDLKSSLVESAIFQEFNNSFIFAITNLNVEQIQKVLDQLKRNLLERENTFGHEILQMTKEVCNLYLLCMRSNNLMIENGDSFIQDFNEYADDCNSIQELFHHLSKTILDSVSAIIDDRKQETTKPIRLAKQYIEANYMNSITIDEVSLKVGFSASHFSTMFKKETGVTFLEYLSSIRMKHAKELLKGGNKNIASICEEVGYSDVKYFTKSFRKYTGLKPNEYRKLYS